ncbi:ATP-dependent DNA helicase [Propionibacteriaceae bacterium Y2011]
MPEQSAARSRTDQVLDAAVAKIGGAERPGQHEMATAIADAITEPEHLLVQAGTGTGKSLGYLAPSLLALADGTVERVVVATATLALQTQLATKDIPVALDAIAAVTGKRPRAALLKGRSNYACLYRVRDGAPDDGQQALITGAELAATIPAAKESAETATSGDASALGAEVIMLREWAEAELSAGGTADRDGAPSHTDRAWGQVSIPVRECLGAQRCPYGEECFVEQSRDTARAADLVVTNHALLAIDAMHGGTALPSHDAVIVDEAHELVSRMTGAASVELSPQQVERVARRALTWLADDLGLEFLEHGDALTVALESAPAERVTDPDSQVVAAAASLRATARKVASELNGSDDPDRRQALAAVREVHDIAERIATLAESDVVYVNDRERFGREVRVAPLGVAGLLRDRVLTDRTTVFCSATLKIGGDFTSVAGSFGLRATEQLTGDRPASGARADHGRRRKPRATTAADEPGDASAGESHEDADEDAAQVDVTAEGTDDPGDFAADSADHDHPTTWRGLDVGSPFDYRRQGILYLARSLPPPGRDGLPPEVLAEIAELTWAAGGRTLGLFASRRNAEAAAKHLHRELPKMTVLCQGDAQLPELTRRFLEEPETSLFGTLSLWQGIDVPGDTCRLVIIDKIPFPRPDDPLMRARQDAVAEAGGNGFMAVAASHAALLLAQGSGRLIRSTGDRGMVAVLDPRLATARYGSFLRAGMPDFWTTADREVAVEALRRLGPEVPSTV